MDTKRTKKHTKQTKRQNIYNTYNITLEMVVTQISATLKSIHNHVQSVKSSLHFSVCDQCLPGLIKSISRSLQSGLDFLRYSDSDNLYILLPPLQSSWVPRRGEQGPKTIEQIHKDAELEEQREQMKVQHAFISKPSGGHGGRNDGGRNDGGRNDGGGRGGRGGREGRDNQGRGQPPQDEGWNTVPISTKNRPIDTSRLSKITKVGERTLHWDRNARFQYDFCYFFLPSTI